MKRLLMIIFACLMFFAGTHFVWADEIDDLNHQLDTLRRDLDASKRATKPLEENLTKLRTQLTAIQTRVSTIEKQIVQKQEEVVRGEAALADQKKILDMRIPAHYKNAKKAELSLLNLLATENLSRALANFFYQKRLADQDKQTILQIVNHVTTLEQRKNNLESEKVRLAKIKTAVDQQSQFLGGEVGKAKKYQAELSGKIAAISARQQQIVAQKLGSLKIPRSAGTTSGRCSSDLTNGRNPGFSPAVGFFTYGAPHRNGLNQYGALGRAKAGQNEEQILSEYYPGLSLKKDYDQGAQVNVDGHGTFSIEDYTKRIWEVPNSWGDEGGMAALKAQAVAARTYALNSMQRNGHICTTEACQVFRPEPKGGNWEAAVEATKGWVLMDGGNPGFTQYASTHGGYIQNLGKFDGAGGNPGSFGELAERAYDKASPWFYCNWGSRAEYGGTAWMKPTEVADIFNVILLARADSGTTDKLYQPDKPHPDGREVWSPDRVKEELRARGSSPLDSVTDVSVGVDFGSGKTTSVSGGGTSVSAGEFKNFFNLRAPANIQIVGPLFNVEKK